MSNEGLKTNESSDLSQLRNLLFGEQAQQTDDRFEALENSIKSIQRENRQLRQALELEANMRVAADEAQSSQIAHAIDGSLHELSSILVEHLNSDRKQKADLHKSVDALIETLEKSQNEMSMRLLEHLQNEQEVRAKQFELLRNRLATESAQQEAAAKSLNETLSQYVGKHTAVSLNGSGNSAEKASKSSSPKAP